MIMDAMRGPRVDATQEAYQGFATGKWLTRIEVRDFIQQNYTPYEGDGSFLRGVTERTRALWSQVMSLMDAERKAGGVLAIDESTISTITSHAPGYIDKDLETIVGLQTDAPLKRAIMPNGGIRMVYGQLEAYNRPIRDALREVYKHRKTHNDGVFDVYTDEMKAVRKTGVITGLPDAYGRGRIIGDYRRPALYGVDYLLACKRHAHRQARGDAMTEDVIRAREELAEQIRSLEELKQMAASYGFDIGRPATDTREAIQWLYFAYLAAVKEQNGAAMSLGRVSSFLDVYAQRDLLAGRYDEEQIQEMIDHFVMKLRLVRFLRTPSYDALFSGDPTWVTECLGGMGLDGRTLVTRMSYRLLHTLENLGPAPEPNMTVLWSPRLPDGFKRYCARLSAETCSIQYENDELMRVKFGDDYGIACCVSAMRIGKQMQFFGARANLAKALLYAINGGRDEKSGLQAGPYFEPVKGDYLDYEDVLARFDRIMDWLAKLYVDTLNVIHYMHDKYCYERIEMALHDDAVERTLATGIAGLSVVADSLSAIRHARVKCLRNEDGLVVDYEIEGTYPQFGNNDEAVDQIARDVVACFMGKLTRHATYRQSRQTLSILTITSNVVYGQKTGATPDGRKQGEPFAPGANPMHGRDHKGCIASMASVASLPYDFAEDGISYTFSIVPEALGQNDAQRYANLAGLLDGYFESGGHHINVNVLNKDLLLDAMDHPENYPQLTIRVSGYAVNFIKLTREQQLDVINRTFHRVL